MQVKPNACTSAQYVVQECCVLKKTKTVDSAGATLPHSFLRPSRFFWRSGNFRRVGGPTITTKEFSVQPPLCRRLKSTRCKGCWLLESGRGSMAGHSAQERCSGAPRFRSRSCVPTRRCSSAGRRERCQGTLNPARSVAVALERRATSH